MPRKRDRIITAYPKDYREPPKYQITGERRNAHLERLGWCLECKERPCSCEREVGNLFDRPA